MNWHIQINREIHVLSYLMGRVRLPNICFAPPVSREKLLFGIMIAVHSPNGAQQSDIIPGQVQLVIQKSAAGARWKEMMIVMPFARDISGP